MIRELVLTILFSVSVRADDLPIGLLPLQLTEAQRKDVTRGVIVRGTLPVKEASLHEGYAVALLPVTADRVVRAIIDYDAYDDDYMPYVTKAHVVRRENGRTLRYERVEPPILRSRYYRVWATDPITTIHHGVTKTIIMWSYEQGSGNIKATSGSWTILGLRDGRSLLCYSVKADVDSVLPAWALNLATRSALATVVRRVQARALQQQATRSLRSQ